MNGTPNFVEQDDPEVWSAIAAEQTRQQEGLEMIASENFTSAAVMQTVGSVLTNKYAEGYPGHRYYGGCEFVDKVEDLARDRLKALFGTSTSTCSPIQAARPTRRSTSPRSSLAIPCSHSTLLMVATSRTA